MNQEKNLGNDFDELMNRNDEYFLFADFESYIDAKLRLISYIVIVLFGLKCA